MPGFISHTVEAKSVYKKISLKVNKDYLITYSLGCDLSKYAKCRKDTHHKNQEAFIYAMADYLKNNNLEHDEIMLAVLYGHICHYITDETVHPLVRMAMKKCQKNPRNHELIELYYDEYLVKEVLHKTIKSYLTEPLLKTRHNKQIKAMLNTVYEEIYQTKNISKYYKLNLTLYRLLKNIYKIFGYNFIKRITKLNQFINTNHDIDITNKEGQISYNDYQRGNCNLSLDSLYDECVKRSITYIEKINKYLDI